MLYKSQKKKYALATKLSYQVQPCNTQVPTDMRLNEWRAKHGRMRLEKAQTMQKKKIFLQQNTVCNTNNANTTH